MRYEEIPVAALDSVEYLPVSEGNYPMGSTLHQVVPLDLSDYGYVEDEYIISGHSKIYSWPDGEKVAKVIMENAPYCTRILVRKPKNPEKFSGNVIIEMMNWARYYDRSIDAWGNCHEYLMASGDAWVGVTCRAKVMDSLKTFNPERYGKLHFKNPRPEDTWNDIPQSNTYHHDFTDPWTENGLTWDMYSQLGMLVREQTERNPLYGYSVKKVIGTSAIAGDMSTYVAAIDPISCTQDNKPIYDGYLIFMTGAPGNVNQYEEKLHYLDERCKFNAKVPLIRVYTCGDMLGEGHHPDWALMQRHPDMDGPDEYFRSYEIAGTGLILKYVHFCEPCEADILASGLNCVNGRTGKRWNDEEIQTYEFPTRYPLNAAFDNLKKWIDGILPPPSMRLETVGEYPEMKLKTDELGNVMGGLRTPYLDVPAYHFRPDASAVLLEENVLRKLYSSHKEYVERVTASAKDCVEKRTLLERDAMVIAKEAEELKLPL
jgi:hypothetical protein